MQGVYTRHFPFVNYGSISILAAVFALAMYSRVSVWGANRGNAEQASSPATEHAPAICQISADEVVTKCGTSDTLHVDQGVTGQTWSDGSNGGTLIVTGSGQYWWQFIDMSRNTVTNGDFSSGHTGFTSDYTYVKENGNTGSFGALSKEAYYSVSTDPHITHTNFSSFGDHTNGSGKMMVINGSPQNNAVVWAQNITVEPNTSYIFSIWAASAHPSNPAKLTFSINGTQLGVIQLTTTTGLWQNFTVTWTSGTSTSAAIGIVNQNTIASGNDLALDDIVFAPVCRKYFLVTLNPDPQKPTISSN